MKKTILTGLLLAGLFLASSAHAWTQRFIERDVGSFDHFQVWMQGDDRFDVPVGIDGFDKKKANWQQTSNNGQLLVAGGDTLNRLKFTLHFAGSKKAPVSFVFQAWSGNRLVDDATVNWNPLQKGNKRWKIVNGSSWIKTRIGDNGQMAVAEPSTFLLAGMGLLTLVVLRRKVSGRALQA